MIVSNPPWIEAKPTKEEEFEIGNFDEGGKVLEAIFRFAGKRLQKRGALTKDGTLILVYSDLSANLGLSSKIKIEELCAKHGLTVKEKKSIGFKLPSKDTSSSSIDPLSSFKNVSHIIIYEITRK